MVAVLSLVLDLFIGDPEPHPVRALGRFISLAERTLNRSGMSAQASRALGLSVVLFAAAVSFWLIEAVVSLLSSFSKEAGLLLSLLIIAFTVSLKSLMEAGEAVRKALERGDLEEARVMLRSLAGRDAGNLGEAELAKAVVESTAESFSDGIVAPLFYAMLLGPAGAVAYKVVNTFDSMWGYRDQRYLHFGWGAAKLDDLANFLPSRISALALTLASHFQGGRSREVLRIARKYSRTHRSPNAGWPESALAGALGLRLGGPRSYGGKELDLPYLGEGKEPVPSDIARAASLIRLSSWCFALLGALVLFFADKWI